MKDGGLLDVTKEFDWNEAKDTDPTAKQSVTVDGKVYGAPFYVGVRALYYRKDVFEELGLSVPKPMAELASTARKIRTAKPDLYGLAVGGAFNSAGYFLNSLLVAGCVVIASALIAFLAATAVTRFRFRLRTALLIMFLVAQMVPVEALTIPLFFLMRDFGRLNTLGTLILPHIAFSLPFAIWMLRGFVKAVPEALEEAACIDGASRTRFLWQILFPLVLPGLVATSVFLHLRLERLPLRQVVHHQ
ncbi:ABC-type glycerol-3-phosphate transport system permease component [Streptomyces caelestis]|uniref:ABC-type glycerol-3-phosphate transport system permease component n=1 Tax=Streptomyces caelestis TaxID=36816 RepID=A0A7W9LT25_9ACTN|nr:ABC-type glycerol-3-phosphate transport system permease component [Streptomyces caelestis]